MLLPVKLFLWGYLCEYKESYVEKNVLYNVYIKVDQYRNVPAGRGSFTKCLLMCSPGRLTGRRGLPHCCFYLGFSSTSSQCFRHYNAVKYCIHYKWFEIKQYLVEQPEKSHKSNASETERGLRIKKIIWWLGPTTVIWEDHSRHSDEIKRRMKIFMIISYHILLGLPLYSFGLSAGLYCGSDTPLDTPYFSPFYKTIREATGCSRAVTDSEDQEVHVVRLDQPAENVFLYVTGKAGLSSAPQSTDCNTNKGSTNNNNNNSLALVLASPTPVTWHLTSSGYNSHTDILISDGSRVLDIETGEELPSSPAILSTVVITENLALAKFSYIHSFTSLRGANRIFIRLPSGRNININIYIIIASPQSCRLLYPR